MHKRAEQVFASLMKWIMQAGQTHSVYVIALEDYEAFFPAKHDIDGPPSRGSADQLGVRSIG